MDLSEELARRCVIVKRALDAEADELTPMREEFEDLAARERVARGQAARYRDLAKERAREEEEKTPSETFTGRLYPVPHTMGEAAWRIPAIAAGGVMGHQFVAGRELPDLDSLRKHLAATAGSEVGTGQFDASKLEKSLAERFQIMGMPAEKALVKAKEHRDLMRRNQTDTVRRFLSATPSKDPLNLAIRDELMSHGLDVLPPSKHEKTLAKNVKTLASVLGPGEEIKTKVPGLSNVGQQLESFLTAQNHGQARNATVAIEGALARHPEHVGAALGVRPDALITEEAAAIRKAIEGALGKEVGGRSSLSVVRDAVHAAGSGEYGTGLSKWKRYGGAGLGALLATLATGVPLGLRALALRREGGEAAVRAKERMQEELGRAEEASGQREEILKRLETQA